MAAHIEDVIYGSTPLENQLAGVHPRLHFVEADLVAIRRRLSVEPWKTFLAETAECAETTSSHQAFMFALTHEPAWLDRAVKSVTAFLDKPSSAFCQMYYMALCYDWLYHDLDAALKQRLETYLNTTGRHEYEAMAKHERYQSGVYGWNIAGEEFGNIAAAAFALHGEVPNVAPWVRYVSERARVVTQALGPDGVSAEGICYGGFFTDTYIKTIDMVNTLMGVDLFEGNTHLRNLPWFYAFSALPQKRMKDRNSLLCFGDGHTGHWYGPASYLHRIAARYRDPVAQWSAAQYRAAGASTKLSSLYSLLWHDPTVPAKPPRPLPLARRFDDKDIVFMRSDWKGDETILAFKCGPHAGHHALNHYPQCIGGGHMACDVGTILLYGKGQRLINDGGYAKKYTSFRNTVLVNGKGQTGETDGKSDWFECSELRREKRGPSILRCDLSPRWDYMIGNVAPAYDAVVGLTRYLRHVLYLRPGTVLLVDELASEKPSTFELWFHADADRWRKPERPFLPVADHAWESGTDGARCRITSLSPDGVVAEPGTQHIIGIGAHADFDIDVLRLRNAKPARSCVFVTVLDVHDGRKSLPLPELKRRGKALTCRLHIGSKLWTCRLSPGRKNLSQAIVSDARFVSRKK